MPNEKTEGIYNLIKKILDKAEYNFKEIFIQLTYDELLILRQASQTIYSALNIIYSCDLHFIFTNTGLTIYKIEDD